MSFILRSIFSQLRASRGRRFRLYVYSAEHHRIDFSLVMVKFISVAEMRDRARLKP
jgi:hypothetical protein